MGVKGVRVFELTVPRQLMEELIPARDFHILMRLFHYTPGMIVLNDALPDNCAIVINQEHEVRVGMPVSPFLWCCCLLPLTPPSPPI